MNETSYAWLQLQNASLASATDEVIEWQVEKYHLIDQAVHADRAFMLALIENNIDNTVRSGKFSSRVSSTKY